MQEQRGARWLAHKAHELGADDTNDTAVSGHSESSPVDAVPPPGFSFFDCIRSECYAESMTALAELGIRVKEGR
jgi:hypothetical protein